MTSTRLQDRTVLIVDDDEDILSSVELAVRAEGANTLKAADGSAAVLAWQSQNPDAVVLDMMLPRASGFVVLEKIREAKDPPVVVMITANQGKRHAEYAQGLGVGAYMTKPVPLQRLVETLAKLLQGKKSRPRPPAPTPTPTPTPSQTPAPAPAETSTET